MVRATSTAASTQTGRKACDCTLKRYSCAELAQADIWCCDCCFSQRQVLKKLYGLQSDALREAQTDTDPKTRSLAPNFCQAGDWRPFSKDFGAGAKRKSIWLHQQDCPARGSLARGATQSSTNRTSGGDSVLPAQPDDSEHPRLSRPML